MNSRRTLMSFGLMLAAYVCTGMHQIRPGERAVVRRFGRVLEEKPAPGLWIGLPWGMDRVERIGVSLVRRIEVGDPADANDPATAKQFLTGDHNLVNVRLAVDYAVAPREEDFVDYALYRDRTDGVVARVAETVLAEWVAGRGIDDILIRGKAEIPQALVPALGERLRGYELGVEIQNAAVVHLLPPDEVKPAFDDVTRAQADVVAREEQARQAAARRLGDAQSQRYAKEQQATAEGVALLLQARAQATVFEKRLAEYQRLRRDNPNILTAIWWDHLSRLFSGMKETGRLDLLDNHLGGDGLDITVLPPMPEKK